VDQLGGLHNQFLDHSWIIMDAKILIFYNRPDYDDKAIRDFKLEKFELSHQITQATVERIYITDTGINLVGL